MKLNHAAALDRLLTFQRQVRKLLADARHAGDLSSVSRASSSDTIYAIDAAVEPFMLEFFEDWGRETPLVLIAEGLENETGSEGSRVFPAGIAESDAAIRVIVDPIDGTRGIMYDKRSAWSLAGVAPNKGPSTSLRDIELAAMTELPTSKAGFADELWAAKGRGAQGRRIELKTGDSQPLAMRPSQAQSIDHGFATVVNFFPGTKVLAAELMEQIAQELIGPTDVHNATVFEDQYISTGGQFYELIVGHDRFIADLRPLFYRIQNQPCGLCCHPYDCATLLIAEEAGVVVTDGFGKPLDAPMDVTGGVAWAAYANGQIRQNVESLVKSFLAEYGVAAQ